MRDKARRDNAVILAEEAYGMLIAQPQTIDAGQFAPQPDVEVRWRPRSFLFGPFLFQPERQWLSKGEAPVRIGGRAMDLLTVLVERPGEMVGKEALMARAWPRTFVDPANLKVNMAALRRALGESVEAPRYIATVVGRGYRFVGAVRCIGATAP